MKRMFLAVILLGIVGLMGWYLGNRLSSDALSMALGIFFGVLAGVPTALLTMAAGRSNRHERGHETRHVQRMPAASYGAQPPVIILAGQGLQPGWQQAPASLPGPDTWPGPGHPLRERQFRVVGEQDEWVEEW